MPFTHIINAVVAASLITGRYKEYTFPMSLGALFTGSMISQMYPNGLSSKYGLSVSTIQIADVFTHWLPAYLIYKNTNKVRFHHMVFGMVVPLLYFSYKYKSHKMVHPLKHLMETYPGVPFWVFTLYIGGVLFPKVLQK